MNDSDTSSELRGVRRAHKHTEHLIRIIEEELKLSPEKVDQRLELILYSIPSEHRDVVLVSVIHYVAHKLYGRFRVTPLLQRLLHLWMYKHPLNVNFTRHREQVHEIVEQCITGHASGAQMMNIVLRTAHHPYHVLRDVMRQLQTKSPQMFYALVQALPNPHAMVKPLRKEKLDRLNYNDQGIHPVWEEDVHDVDRAPHEKETTRPSTWTNNTIDYSQRKELRAFLEHYGMYYLGHQRTTRPAARSRYHYQYDYYMTAPSTVWKLSQLEKQLRQVIPTLVSISKSTYEGQQGVKLTFYDDEHFYF
jgi:hypothetical protein